ncbi:hypothetical protein E4U22_001942 [Claviceps purpurea]|nr:hypothetical protein E4U22_001942 [Claviceps purpurea]
MAAAEVSTLTASWAGRARDYFPAQPLTTGWDETSLRVQLNRISYAWTEKSRAGAQSTIGRTLVVPDYWSRKSDRLPDSATPPPLSHHVKEPHETTSLATRREPPSDGQSLLDSPPEAEPRSSKSKDDLFSDPFSGVEPDWNIQDGSATEAKGKKKKKGGGGGGPNRNPVGNSNGNKNEDEHDDNDEGDGGEQGDDDTGGGGAGENSGAGDGDGDGNNGDGTGDGADNAGDGDKDEDENEAEDSKKPNLLDDFVPANSKKKRSKKNADPDSEDPPMIPSIDSGGNAFESFQFGGGDEANNTNIDSTDTKTNVTTWGTVWEPEQSGGAKTDDAFNSSVWGTTRKNTKNKMTPRFGFGALDNHDTPTVPVSKESEDDSWGFSKKNNKKGNKKNKPEDELEPPPASNPVPEPEPESIPDPPPLASSKKDADDEDWTLSSMNNKTKKNKKTKQVLVKKKEDAADETAQLDAEEETKGSTANDDAQASPGKSPSQSLMDACTDPPPPTSTSPSKELEETFNDAGQERS